MAQIEYRFQETPPQNVPLESVDVPRYYCVWMQFPRETLKKVDEVARFAKNEPRDKTLRVMLCAFGKKLGVEVPDGPLPDPAQPYMGELPWFTIGVVVPPAKDPATWVSRLLEETKAPSFRQLIMQAVKEFDWSTLGK
jgi:hypothetical protein